MRRRRAPPIPTSEVQPDEGGELDVAAAHPAEADEAHDPVEDVEDRSAGDGPEEVVPPDRRPSVSGAGGVHAPTAAVIASKTTPTAMLGSTIASGSRFVSRSMIVSTIDTAAKNRNATSTIQNNGSAIRIQTC